MTDFIKVKATGYFTLNTERGIVHADHQSSDERAREPEIPVDQVASLVERGLIDDPFNVSVAVGTGFKAAFKPVDKRKAALAKANAARAAKAAAKKAAGAAPAPETPDNTNDAPAE